jgi:hypothetical protein
VLERLGPRASARDVELEAVQFARKAWADEDTLRWVLIKFIDHAIRSVVPGAAITVMTTPRKNGTELRVINWVAGASSTRRRGHDFGYCELAIEALGGSVWYEDGAASYALCIRLPNDP